MEKCNATETNDAVLIKGSSATEVGQIHGRFEFVCYDKDGNEKWRDYGLNIVTDQGKNGMLNTYLGLSPALPSNWWMSLITAGAAISTSTYAAPTVTEITSGIVATRPTMGWAAASTGSKASTTTAFAIIGTASIIGNKVVTATSGGATVGDTAGAGGILFSSSNFTGGAKSVSSGDLLNVSYSLSI